MKITAFVISVTALTLAFTGCRGEEAPEEPGTRIAIEDLGIAFADLPSRCADSSDGDFELTCTSEEGVEGTLTLEVWDPDRGTNLLAAAEDQKEAFEAMEGGEFFGNRELVTPMGSAYTARGGYLRGGERIEESRVLALHPEGDRVVVFHYAYPAGDDTRARIDQLLYLVGEMEGPVAAGPGEEGDAEDAAGT